LKHFLRNNGIWVLIVALLLTAAISLGSVFAPGFTAPVTHAIGVLGTPFRAAATFFTDRVEAAYDYAFRYHLMENRLAELENQVAEMSEENRAAQAALEENERLRELLKLSQARSDFVFESATVTARSTTGWESTLTISKGSSSGVEKEMCVVTEQGYLVGVITDVGPNWATVTTLIDPSISIGAVAEQTGDAAVLTGDLDSMTQGLCRLSYLASTATLAVGDAVITSGLGGVYPSGITVGVVCEEGFSASGMERYAVVQPSVDLDALQQVFVIKSFEVIE
jgi:rod shape-determining protein MreC